MPTPPEPTIEVVAAAAAAVVTSKNLTAKLKAQVNANQKFVVHPHVAVVDPTDALLRGYLRRIYTARRSVAATYPASPDFAKLGAKNTVSAATRALAGAMALEMSKRNAKAGIFFGFALKVDGVKAHGVIKADLDDEQRFHFVTKPNDEWSLGEVSDILPPPSIDYAKFAIAPQPGGPGAIGVLDITQQGTAADYFLSSVLIQVPRTRGTKAAVAQAAMRHGYTPERVHEILQQVTEDTPVENVVEENFPNVPDMEIERLRGSTARPMPTVVGDDQYIRTFKTSEPLFELRVDETVTVEVSGLTITVTLPPDSGAIQKDIRPR